MHSTSPTLSPNAAAHEAQVNILIDDHGGKNSPESEAGTASKDDDHPVSLTSSRGDQVVREFENRDQRRAGVNSPVLANTVRVDVFESLSLIRMAMVCPSRVNT